MGGIAGAGAQVESRAGPVSRFGWYTDVSVMTADSLGLGLGGGSRHCGGRDLRDQGRLAPGHESLKLSLLDIITPCCPALLETLEPGRRIFLNRLPAIDLYVFKLLL